MEGAGRRRQILEISAVCPVVCVDGEMSADSADKRQTAAPEVDPSAGAAAGSGGQEPGQPVNSCLIVSFFFFCLVTPPFVHKR